MVEPEKPFACNNEDCRMTFTNEDHLNVHIKKHDMMLQLGQKALFLADQTPTPTRFIRSCEEVDLFQDLQNVNPFEEGFKRAMENKNCTQLSVETPVGDGSLHTPTFFPLPEPNDTTLQTNVRQNVTIQRSSSDESNNAQTVKCMYETNTISTQSHESNITITKTIEKKQIEIDSSADYSCNSFNIQEITNVETPYQNVAVTKPALYSTITNSKIYKKNKLTLTSGKAVKPNNVPKDKNNTSKISRESSNSNESVSETSSDTDINNIEVLLRFPGGKQIKMESVGKKPENDVKNKLKECIETKNQPLNVFLVPAHAPNSLNLTGLPLGSGCLIPVSPIVVPKDKMPITRISPYAKRKRKPANNADKVPNKQNKTISHNPECAILKTVGAECSMNCGNIEGTTINVNEKEIDREPSIEEQFQSIAEKLIQNEKNQNIDKEACNSSFQNVEFDEENSNISSIIAIDHNICSVRNEEGSVTAKNQNEERRNLVKLDNLGATFGSIDYGKAGVIEANRRYRKRQRELRDLLKVQNDVLLKENKYLTNKLTEARNEILELKLLFINHMKNCSSSE